MKIELDEHMLSRVAEYRHIMSEGGLDAYDRLAEIAVLITNNVLAKVDVEEMLDRMRSETA